MGNLVPFFQVFAAASACKNTFLGLLPWNYYLTMDSSCSATNFHLLGANSSLLLIGLAIIDDLLRIAGLLAVIFVIYAGVKFIMSQGSPDEAAKARSTAINALVGLAITMVAIAFVSFLGNQVGGTTQGGVGNNLNLSSLPNPIGADNGNIIQTVLSIVFAIMGALSFMVIVIAGFRYSLSQGDPKSAAQAKSTIIYALIGLILAIAAQSVVSLAVSRS